MTLEEENKKLKAASESLKVEAAIMSQIIEYQSGEMSRMSRSIDDLEGRLRGIKNALDILGRDKTVLTLVD